MFYRIVIQNNPDGSLSGAAAYDTPASDARAITEDDLKTLMPDVNAAALDQRAAIEAEQAAVIAAITAERDAAIAKCAAIEAAAKHPDATIEIVLAEVSKEQNQREREELEKLLAQKQQEEADIQAKIDSLPK